MAKWSIAKVYYDKARQMCPNERDKSRLMLIAESVKIAENSFYGNFGKIFVTKTVE